MSDNPKTEPAGAADDTTEGPSALKKIYQATLGGGAVIKEESVKLFDYLVERGAPLEEPVRQHVANAREKIDRAVGRAVNRSSNQEEEKIAELSAAADRLRERAERL